MKLRTREKSEPRPILRHMPANIKEKIADAADVETSRALRATSKEFKEMIQRPEMHCEDLRVTFASKRRIELHICWGENWKTMIFKHDLKETGYLRIESAIGKTEREYIEDPDSVQFQYFKEIADWFKALVSNPNLTVDLFEFEFNCVNCEANTYIGCYNDRMDFLRIITNGMQSRNTRLPVQRFNCVSNRSWDSLPVLPYLDHHVLEKFTAKRVMSYHFCFNRGYTLSENKEKLRPEEWWDIPVTFIYRPQVKDLKRILQHVRETPTFISFLGSWLQPAHLLDFSEYAEIKLESFGDGVEWRSQNGKHYGKIAASDPNFVIKIGLCNDKNNQYVKYKRLNHLERRVMYSSL